MVLLDEETFGSLLFFNMIHVPRLILLEVVTDLRAVQRQFGVQVIFKELVDVISGPEYLIGILWSD